MEILDLKKATSEKAFVLENWQQIGYCKRKDYNMDVKTDKWKDSKYSTQKEKKIGKLCQLG